MTQFSKLCTALIAAQFLFVVGCGGSSVPVNSNTNSNASNGSGGSNAGSGTGSGTDAGTGGSAGQVGGTPTEPEEQVSEIEITFDDGFTFQQDTGSRADKVVGTFDFAVRNPSTGRYIRDLNSSNMVFKERTLGSDSDFVVEVEATQSSSIEITPIDVMYLIDNSYSVVQSGANTELLNQANELAAEINTRNGSSSTASNVTRFRTFADSVGALKTSTAATPFSTVSFEEQGGGTALYEGMYNALMDLSTSAHPVLFVFTDGRENASAQGYNLDLVLSTAANYGIPVYIAGLGNVDSNVLGQIASTSGGQFFQAETADELADTFENVLYSIPAEYTVTYRPTQRAGHIEFQFVVEYGEASDTLVGDFNVDEILGE
ncbi:MAG: vWA domain-containing protein [Pseudomonadota bacterium]|nr:vWA domain-containing protein [Pseudomonadota bacterium]